MLKILTNFLFFFVVTTAIAQQKLSCEWLFIYYMPYDNNLSKEGQIILDEIKAGIKSDNVVVSIQADLTDSSGMKRYLVGNNSWTESNYDSEFSGDCKSYSDYLSWVSESVTFEKCVLIFLDHGGGLNELCLDEYPKNEYLKSDSLKNIIKDFKLVNKVSVELIFLQVCAKGVLEPLYDFRDCADYTLCSQNELGAPNYYYAGLFNYLKNNDYLTGDAIAQKIAEFERSDMYFSYTCVNNAKINSFVKELNDFIYLLAEKDSIYIHIDSLEQIYYYGETHWDLASFVFHINEADSSLLKKRQKLLNALSTLVVFHHVNSTNNKMNGYCGISILAPKAKDYNARFEGMEFFSVSNLNLIAEKISVKGEYIFIEDIIFR